MRIEFDLAARVRALDPENRLCQGRLAGAGLTNQPECLAVMQSQVDVDQRRHVVAALVECLRDARQRQREIAANGVLANERRRLDQLTEAIAVVAARPAPIADLRDRRLDGSTQVARERAAIDKHAGREIRPDLGQVARDGGERPFRLPNAAAGERSQERQGVRMLRVLEQGRRTPLLDDLAGVHDADAIAQRPDDAQIVGDEQDGGVGLGLEGTDEIEHAGFHGRIEAGRRLIEHEQLRVRCQGDGDDHSLLHAARKLMGIALVDPPGVGNLDPSERLDRVGLRFLPALAKDREGLGDLGPDLGRRIEGRARILVDHRGVAHPKAADLVVGHLRDVVTGHQDPATGDHGVPRQVADGCVGRGGLAAPRLTDQAE